MEGAILSNLISNATAEFHADQQYHRERKLMDAQNAMNNANALGAYQRQVQGMRMAGLSPAGAMNQAPQQVTATKGSVGMAENVEFDPSAALLSAQAENLRAQTEKTRAETDKIEGVDTKNVEADTDFKNANTLFTGANTEKVNEEAQNIRNVNEQYDDQKKGIALFGQTAAQDWQKQPWYDSMTSGQKQVIDAIAKGEVDLSPGTLSALSNSIKASGEMSDYQKNLAVNTLARTVVEKQLTDPEVVNAMVKDVQAKYNLTQKQIDNLKANTSKTLYKMKDLIDLELQGKKYGNQISKAEAALKTILQKAEKQGNIDYLRNEGDYGNYAWKVLENGIARVFDLAMLLLGARVAGKTAGKAAAETPKGPKYFQGSDGKWYPEITPPGPPGPVSDNPFPHDRNGSGSGVQNMRFRH